MVGWLREKKENKIKIKSFNILSVGSTIANIAICIRCSTFQTYFLFNFYFIFYVSVQLWFPKFQVVDNNDRTLKLKEKTIVQFWFLLYVLKIQIVIGLVF